MASKFKEDKNKSIEYHKMCLKEAKRSKKWHKQQIKIAKQAKKRGFD